MVQELEANPRKSGIQKFVSAIAPAIESGLKIHGEHRRQKDYGNALKGLEDIYSNPELSESQKLIGAYQRLAQFPEAAQQLAGPLSRIGAQENKFSQQLLGKQQKQEQLNQSIQNIKDIYNNPDLSQEDKTLEVYRELNQNPTLAHHILQSLEKPAKAQSNDIAGQQLTEGWSAIEQGDKEALKKILNDPKTSADVKAKLIHLRNEKEARDLSKSREQRYRQEFVQNSYNQAIKNEQELLKTVGPKEKGPINDRIKKLKQLRKADLHLINKDPDNYGKLNLWNVVDPEDLAEMEMEDEQEFIDEPVEAEKQKVKFDPKNPEHVHMAKLALEMAKGDREKANEILAEGFIYE
jgi:hypothetical protein